MSTHLLPIPCHFCDQIVYGYQELLNHVQSHQNKQQKEIYNVQGSDILSLPLSKHSEWIQHVRTMRNGRADSQSPPLFLSNSMLTHPSLICCTLCGKSVLGYQEFMKHVLSHPIDDEKEIQVVRGSNNLNKPLPEPLESIQHEKIMRNKRPKLQPTPPALVHPRWVRGNTNMHVSQQLPLLLPPLPSFYDNRWIRGNDYGRSVYINQQLSPPSLYRANSIRGHNDGRDMHTNQELLSVLTSYHPLSVRRNDDNIGVQANQLQQMFQPTRTYVPSLIVRVMDLNETPPQFEGNK